MQRVLILGATSAIAAEVAVIHALRGDRLHLVGRNPDKLEAVAHRCRASEVTSQVADFDDLAHNATVVQTAIATLGELDIVLLAHGLLGDQLATERSFEDAAAVIRTNYTSVISLLIPLANHVESAHHGRIGVITSVAGDRGRPRNYTYGSAKGALSIYLQGLRTRLYPSGASITTLKLGPVDTPMTHDHKKHVLFGKPAAVAKDIVRAIEHRTPEAYVPSIWGAIMPVVRGAPERLIQALPVLSGR